jgi:hypothetical protein
MAGRSPHPARVRRVAGRRAAVVVGSGPMEDSNAVAADYDGSNGFCGASLTRADFSSANFRDCDLRPANITDS